MRHYTRAKEFIKRLAGVLRSGAEERVRAFKRQRRPWAGSGWSFSRFKEGVRGLHRNFDRKKIVQHRSFQALKNFDYEKFFDQLLSPQSYRTIHLIFLVTVVVVLMYGVGKMAAHILLPHGAPITHKAAGQGQNFLGGKGVEKWEQILARDLFRTENRKAEMAGAKRGEKAKAKPGLVCRDSDKKSSLPLVLVNTVVLQNREKSVASVRDENKKKILYLREGDSLENISVKKISRLKMVFANRQTGQCEYIANRSAKDDRFWQARKPQILSPDKGRKLLAKQKNENVVKVGNTYQIKRELKEDILNNINTILTQARAIEIKNPDGSLCFKMVDIVPGSPYSILDIQNDDIICNINGKKIEDLNSLFALFGKMREIQNFEMVINRDGQEIPMEYNFE